MPTLDDVLETIVSNVDGAIACAIVDLNSGMLMGVAHNVSYLTYSYLDAVAAAAVDMFRGKNIRAVEALLGNQRGKPVEKAIHEIQMITEKTLHFMSLVKGNPDYLMVLITSKTTNLGLGWAALRNNMDKITPYCP